MAPDLPKAQDSLRQQYLPSITVLYAIAACQCVSLAGMIWSPPRAGLAGLAAPFTFLALLSSVIGAGYLVVHELRLSLVLLREKTRGMLPKPRDGGQCHFELPSDIHFIHCEPLYLPVLDPVVAFNVDESASSNTHFTSRYGYGNPRSLDSMSDASDDSDVWEDILPLAQRTRFERPYLKIVRRERVQGERARKRAAHRTKTLRALRETSDEPSLPTVADAGFERFQPPGHWVIEGSSHPAKRGRRVVIQAPGEDRTRESDGGPDLEEAQGWEEMTPMSSILPLWASSADGRTTLLT